MTTPLPRIGVVIIGINVAPFIETCIQSVLNCDYPQELIEVIYVDGGSNDSSVTLASGFQDVRVLSLDLHHPTPGSGRNAGWRSISPPVIQFMDADTTLEARWFKTALPHLTDAIPCVCGFRRERHPKRNRYHQLTEMEWRYEEGPCRYFGGEALLYRYTLEQTGGFDKDLIAGEDPELSRRMRQKGWEILRIAQPMSTHDINMSTFTQYLKRAYRSGHAYAEIGLRFARTQDPLWLKELLRVAVRGSVPLLILLIGLLFDHPIIALLIALAISARPLYSLPSIERRFGCTRKEAILYASHTAFVVFPQFSGVLRYLIGKGIGKPLHNNAPTSPPGRRDHA